ncbi:MAG: DUF6440 family protein [Candidatus Omnitrophota bacterium]
MRYFLIFLICCIGAIGAVAVRSAYAADDTAGERFQSVYEQRGRLDYVQILLDKETGVKYLFCKYGNGAAMMKLEEKNADKVEVKEEEKKDAQ